MGNILDIDNGKILVATDIHGNWEDYVKIREKYKTLKRNEKADILAYDGDIIHSDGKYEDKSLEILDDLIDNPDKSIIPVLGNHELMHIYHLEIKKGEMSTSFAEPLEIRIEQERKNNREKYIKFMKQMPYAIRTKGGVVINHTGPNPPMAGFCRKGYENLVKFDSFRLMNQLDHDKILNPLKDTTRELIEQDYGHKLADNFFDDFSPQIGQIFSSSPIGNYLWDVFFNMNEFDFKGGVYNLMLDNFLKTMSNGNKKQEFLVSGHIWVPDGYKTINGTQLRICSSSGTSDSNKVLALVDASKEYVIIEGLVQDLQYLNH